MSNQEILEKAIQRAIDGGWDKIDSLTFSRAWANERADHVKFNAFETGNAEVGGVTFDLNTVIYNHDFAKALWGKEHKPYALVFQRVTNGLDIPHAVLNGMLQAWQHHLQQMVVAEDPIKYLGENI